MDADIKALEKGERNPAPSTRTHDLLSLELRYGGRGRGQAEAINTSRRLGAQVTQEAAAVPVREAWQKTCGSACVSTSPTPRPVTWVPIPLLGRPLSLTVSATHSLRDPVPPPQDSGPPTLGLVFPSHSERLSPTRVFVCLSGSPPSSLTFPLWVSCTPPEPLSPPLVFVAWNSCPALRPASRSRVPETPRPPHFTPPQAGLGRRPIRFV